MSKDNSITIDYIGIETEMVLTQPYLNKKRNNEYFDYKSIRVCNDDEYYSDQIEFKMMQEKFDDDICQKIKEFKEFVSLDDTMRINGNNWTGTHIHIFPLRGWKELKRMINCKMSITAYLLDEIIDFLVKWLEDWTVSNKAWRYELQRLALSHNIWRYFDTERMGDALRRNLQTFWDDYTQFSKGVDRPKYAPVIWSLPNEETGKPLSLELRLFPNSFFLLTEEEKIKEILENVIKLVNNAKKETDEDRIEYANRIRTSHLKIASAYSFVDNMEYDSAYKILTCQDLF